MRTYLLTLFSTFDSLLILLPTLTVSLLVPDLAHKEPSVSARGLHLRVGLVPPPPPLYLKRALSSTPPLCPPLPSLLRTPDVVLSVYSPSLLLSPPDALVPIPIHFPPSLSISR
ncbi:hypothetical protein B0H16DRAFT_1904111 [Mycena metata]|uniref:Uncharacterized protein n=1 Tax=Mycena metata TaxID=1033252 RepID=A0AAD7GHG7_9AGAR|nr:hypothetical protein B0H16DRAFT_1904111 [Mycena metata]